MSHHWWVCVFSSWKSPSFHHSSVEMGAPAFFSDGLEAVFQWAMGASGNSYHISVITSREWYSHGNTWVLVASKSKKPRRGRLSWYINNHVYMYTVIYMYIFSWHIASNQWLYTTERSRTFRKLMENWDVLSRRGFKLLPFQALQGEITLLPIY